MGAVGRSVGVRTAPSPAAHLCPPPAWAVGTLSCTPLLRVLLWEVGPGTREVCSLSRKQFCGSDPSRGELGNSRLTLERAAGRENNK